MIYLVEAHYQNCLEHDEVHAILIFVNSATIVEKEGHKYGDSVEVIQDFPNIDEAFRITSELLKDWKQIQVATVVKNSREH